MDTWAEFRAAVRSGNHVVVTGSTVLDGAGLQLTIPANVTIDGDGSAIFRNVWFAVRGDNVVLRDLRIRTGDEDTSVDADAISINGASNVAITNVEAIWAADVGGLTILNTSTDITVQCSILGVGLLRSNHPESEDSDGHGLGVNVAGLSSSSFPQRVTLDRNLITTSEGRMPRVQGARCVDLVNNVIYNYREGPAGNPQSLNMVGNRLKHGPASAAAGLGAPRREVWRTQTSSDFGSVFAQSVYLEGNTADGFTPINGAGAGVLRSSPACPLSVTPLAGNVQAQVLAVVGPRPLDARSTGWITQAQNRTGSWWNGEGFPPPNPVWP